MISRLSSPGKIEIWLTWLLNSLARLVVAERLIDALERSPNIDCKVITGVGVGVLTVLGVGVVVTTSAPPRAKSQTMAPIRINPIPSKR